MGMPEVPKRDKLPNIKEALIQILESVALEELAMAHIMNAEGEKMQAIIANINHHNVCDDCISEAFKSTNSTINNLIMKEWVMLNKISKAFDIYTKIEKDYHKPHPHCKNNHCQKDCNHHPKCRCYYDKDTICDD